MKNLFIYLKIFLLLFYVITFCFLKSEVEFDYKNILKIFNDIISVWCVSDYIFISLEKDFYKKMYQVYRKEYFTLRFSKNYIKES